MNYLYPWSAHFNITDEQLSDWESENKSHLPLAVWAIQNKKFSESEFQQWAQNFYTLPVMKSGFFQQPVAPELWKQTKELFIWTEVLLPLYQWDGTLFVGCIEPARNLDLNCEIQFVLCRFEDLCFRWHQYQNQSEEQNGNGLRKVAFDEAAENPTTNGDFDLNVAEEQLAAETVTQKAATQEPTPSQSPEPEIEVVVPNSAPETAEAAPQESSAKNSAETSPKESVEKSTEKSNSTPGMRSIGTVKLNLKSEKKEKKSANAVLADMMGGTDEYEVQVISPEEEANKTPAAETPTPDSLQSDLLTEPVTEAASEQTSEPVSEQPEGINLDALKTPSQNEGGFDFDQLAKNQGIEISSEESQTSESSNDEVPEGMEGLNLESDSDSSPIEGLSLDSKITSFDFSSVSAEIENQEPEVSESVTEEKPQTPPPAPQAQELSVDATGTFSIDAIGPDTASMKGPLETPPPAPRSAPEPKQPDSVPPPAPASAAKPDSTPPPAPPAAAASSEEQDLSDRQSFQDEAPPPPESDNNNVVFTDTNTSLQLESVKNLDELAAFIFNKMDNDFERKILYSNYRGQGFEPVRWSEHWHATKSAKTSAVDVRSPNMFYIAHKTKKPFHGQVSPNPINDQFFVRWNKGQYLPAMTIYPVIAGDEEVIAFLVGTPRSSDFNFDVLHQLSHFAPQVAPALSVMTTKAA